jgi:amino acid transporter
MHPSSKKILGSFTLAMIAVVAIIDLRSLPMMASYGFSAIFIYTLAAILFFIPSGLVCAELSTRVAAPGGMYTWVREAFGEPAGFFSIWLEWLNNVIGFPASLSFMCVSLSYLIDPQLAQHKFFILTTTLSLLWLITLFTLTGIKSSSRLNMFSALFGTIIPALAITVLGLIWFLSGKALQIQLHWSSFIPNAHTLNPGFFAAIILGFGGMQIIAFHSTNVIEPQRSYPRAIFMTVFIVLAIAMLSTIAVAAVVPHGDLNIISGLIDGFNDFFKAFHMPWPTSVMVGLIVLGMFGTFNAWFLGPARGLAIAAKNGYFPKIFSHTNKKDVPVNILIMQAIICSLLSTLFLFMPDISSGFWLLLNLSSQSALVVYILIFAAAIKLRLSSELNPSQGFKIPGGRCSMYLVAGTGIITCVIAILASVVPPSLIKVGKLWHYEGILLASNIIFLGIPFIINYFYSQSNLFVSSERNL